MNHVLLVDDLPDALSLMQEAVRTAFGNVHCTLAASVAEAINTIDPLSGS